MTGLLYHVQRSLQHILLTLFVLVHRYPRLANQSARSGLGRHKAILDDPRGRQGKFYAITRSLSGAPCPCWKELRIPVCMFVVFAMEEEFIIEQMII